MLLILLLLLRIQVVPANQVLPPCSSFSTYHIQVSIHIKRRCSQFLAPRWDKEDAGSWGVLRLGEHTKGRLEVFNRWLQKSIGVFGGVPARMKRQRNVEQKRDPVGLISRTTAVPSYGMWCVGALQQSSTHGEKKRKTCNAGAVFPCIYTWVTDSSTSIRYFCTGT